MEIVKETEIQYCTSCGAANKKSAVFCEACNIKIIIRHRPVVDFLKKRAKGKVAGKTTEKLFSLIKNFLFDHLYGIILTVSVVTTATVTVATSTPYIEKVTTAPFEKAVVEVSEKVEEPETEITDGIFELTETDIIWFNHVVSAYDAKIDNTRRSGTPYWEDDELYTDAAELWAENGIEGYSYSGTHELYNNPFPMGQNPSDSDATVGEDFWVYHCRYTPDVGARTGINVRSEFGHTLLSDGYDVMEIDFYCLSYNGVDMEGYTFDFSVLPPTDKTPYEKYVYTFLLTRKHGEERWYIAEEVLIESIGVSGQRGE